MTEKITLEEAVKSKDNFSKFIDENSEECIKKALEGLQPRSLHIVIPQMTPSADGLCSGLGAFNDGQKCYVFWFINNEKEEMLKLAESLNKRFSKICGIFIFKPFLNDGKTEFKCLLKPKLKSNKEGGNASSKTGSVQLDYWNAYFDVCDEMGEGDYQVKPEAHHYQNISIGLKGAYIKQTISVKGNYIASELFIPDNKQLFANLKEHEKKIEKELGSMTWDCKDSNKSCNIRRIIFVDFTNPERYKEYAKQQVELAIKVRETFFKYI